MLKLPNLPEKPNSSGTNSEPANKPIIHWRSTTDKPLRKLIGLIGLLERTLLIWPRSRKGPGNTQKKYKDLITLSGLRFRKPRDGRSDVQSCKPQSRHKLVSGSISMIKSKGPLINNVLNTAHYNNHTLAYQLNMKRPKPPLNNMRS